MREIPSAILNYLSNLIIKDQSFAYLLLTKDGNLLSWGGDLSAYGISNLQVGELACNQVILLEGILPLGDEAVVLPCANLEQKNYADIHIFPGHEGDWVLLLDANRERDRYQTMQQKGNDLSLLRDQQAKIINQYFGKEVKDNLAGSVLDLWKRSNHSTELIAVNEQPNHNVVHPDRFGETNGFAS